MDRKDLKNKLQKLGIKDYNYSLSAEIKPDAVILYRNYNKWEVFYVDEKGKHLEKKIFDTETEACDYFYSLLMASM